MRNSELNDASDSEGTGITKDLHPMKGPMTTQSLRGMARAGSMHWRGDRTGGNDVGGSAFDDNAAFLKFQITDES